MKIRVHCGIALCNAENVLKADTDLLMALFNAENAWKSGTDLLNFVKSWL